MLIFYCYNTLYIHVANIHFFFFRIFVFSVIFIYEKNRSSVSGRFDEKQKGCCLKWQHPFLSVFHLRQVDGLFSAKWVSAILSLPMCLSASSCG